MEEWMISFIIVMTAIVVSWLAWTIKDEYGLAEAGLFLGCVAGFTGSVWLVKIVLFGF